MMRPVLILALITATLLSVLSSSTSPLFVSANSNTTTSTSLLTSESPTTSTTELTTTETAPTNMTSSTTTTTTIPAADYQSIVKVNVAQGFTMSDVSDRIAQILGISSNSVRVVRIENSAQGLVLVEFDNVTDVESLLALPSSQLSNIGLLSAAPAPGASGSLTTASPPAVTPSPNNNNFVLHQGSAADHPILYVAVSCGVLGVFIIMFVGIYCHQKSKRDGGHGGGENSVSFNNYIQTVYQTEMVNAPEGVGHHHTPSAQSQQESSPGSHTRNVISEL